MTRTTYEILAMLEGHFKESITLLKQLSSCPGQRQDILIPLSNQLRYVRAQIGYEVTDQASEFEMERATHWGRVHRKFERWRKDPDDVYPDAKEREEQRKKKGLPPRLIFLPWSPEDDEKLLAAKKSEFRKKRKTNRPNRSAKPGPGGE